MLTCEQFDTFMDDFLDGRLPFRTRLSMHMHLGVCPQCRDYVREYRQALAIGRRLCQEDEDIEQVPRELIDAVLQQIERKR